MIRSLRFRLAVGAALAIAVSLCTVWFALSQLFTDFVVARYTTEMTTLADELAAAVIADSGGIALSVTPSDPRLNLPGGGRYWQVEAEGQEPLRSRSLWDTMLPGARTDLGQRFGFVRALGPDGKSALVFSQASHLDLASGRHPFVIRTAFSEQELDLALSGFHGELRRMLALTAIVLVLAAIAQAALGLRPLDRLRHIVVQIRSGALKRLEETGPEETRPLIREINLLLDEREDAVERARQRASDLAHGLKTPLTVLSQLSAGLDPAAREIAERQIELIRQRADRQLQAARLGVERMANADIAVLIGRLAQVLRPLTDDRGLQWRLDVEAGLCAPIDPADLAEALGNVLDNASKWAKSQISVRARRDGGAAVVVISDDGPGIAAEDRQAMLRRGVHASLDGSGLGLAITADIMEAYGGDIALDQSGSGGLAVTLRFKI